MDIHSLEMYSFLRAPKLGLAFPPLPMPAQHQLGTYLQELKKEGSDAQGQVTRSFLCAEMCPILDPSQYLDPLP